MFEVKVFDNTDYESRLACNHELMVLVAGEFIKEAAGLLDALQAHMEGQDLHNFDLVVHRLKGAALEVSAYRFCRLIGEVEVLAAQRNSEALPKSLMALREEFRSLVCVLNQELLL